MRGMLTLIGGLTLNAVVGVCAAAESQAYNTAMRHSIGQIAGAGRTAAVAGSPCVVAGKAQRLREA